VVITTDEKKDDKMKNNFEILKSVELFKGIDAAELDTMLNCLGAETRAVSRDSIILLAGDKPRYVGVVLQGYLHIVREDNDGNHSLLTAVMPGETFAESFCCADVAESPVTVVADVDSIIMQLKFSILLHTCPNSCPYHTKLIENMLWLIANRNLQLQYRMEIVSLKSVRSKILRYLESFVPKQGGNITIPFNREELAGYLCVDRSTLSHELMKMKRDGLISYKKNKFTLHSHN